MQPKLFILIRADIPLADQVVQAGHAVAEWCKRWQNGSKEWDNSTLVYVTVNELSHLSLWQRKLEMKGIEHSIFCEPDMQNQMTTIACLTNKNIFSSLPLFL